MEHEIRVYIALYTTYEVRVTHLGGPHNTRRITDASWYVDTREQVEHAIAQYQQKYSVPAERTFSRFQ
jgi:hypothetical protein